MVALKGGYSAERLGKLKDYTKAIETVDWKAFY